MSEKEKIPNPPKLPTCWNCKWRNRFEPINCSLTNKEIPDPPTCKQFEYDWGVK